MIDDDLEVFYDVDDFAVACTRSRPGEDDALFTAILSTLDEDLFDGHVQAGTHVLRFPTAAVEMQAGDVVSTVAVVNGQPQEPVAWRVLRTPDRVVDGLESQAWIKPDPEA